MTPESESISGRGEQLRQELLQARACVLEEIHAFPPAIPGCDEQFNFLLEQRDALGRDLGRLEDILAAETGAREKARRRAELQRGSTFLQSDSQGA
ncbi:MAG: hypothetical protein OXB89_10525 [Anaerolineaceae bacterium]|nr:hypothetical protein [Anaerolineaceae bacterium]